ncbi:MAG: RNase adapter RapZ, partial [Bacteroidales bacterium]
AIQNLSSIQDHLCKALDLQSIEKIIDYLKESKFSRLDLPCGTNLNLAIHSFSFKQGIPDDSSGNGGGFVFDCRFLPNPGRIEAYKNLNGQDTEVVRYFKEYDSVSKFIDECVEITTPSVLNYIERGFSNLQVNFGCTGGRHRSVYCAEQYAQRMAANFQIKIELKHSNRCNW